VHCVSEVRKCLRVTLLLLEQLLYVREIMAESEEELKSFLMKVKEMNEKAGLEPSIQKMKIMASGSITL